MRQMNLDEGDECRWKRCVKEGDACDQVYFFDYFVFGSCLSC